MSDSVEIIQEINDRNLRKKNVMIYNVVESNSASVTDQTKHDDCKLSEIMSEVGVTDEKKIVRHFRVGKKIEGKIRPIKVITDDQNTAFSILKNKSNCSAPHKLNSDLTFLQRKQLQDLRGELEILNKDTVVKTIKYIRGEPRIVDIKSFSRLNPKK